MLQNSESVDPRIRRTRRALHEALLALIQEQGFESITVQDIAERAAINRVTFYKHYRDKFDLLVQVMEEMLSELTSGVEPPLQYDPVDPVIERVLFRWLEQMDRRANIYRLVLGQSGNMVFMAQLLHYLESFVGREVRRLTGDDLLATMTGQIKVRFIASGLLGVTTWWLEQKRPPSKDVVAKQLHALLRGAMGTPN